MVRSKVLDVAVRGRALIITRDAKTLKVIDRRVINNVITDGGLGVFADAMVGGLRTGRIGATCPVRYSWYLVLGTGTGTPSRSDTGLFNPIGGSARMGSLSGSGTTITYYVRYMPEDANGYEYTEAGIYERVGYGGEGQVLPYTSGVLMNHIMLYPTIVKDSSKLVDFYMMFTFTHV